MLYVAANDGMVHAFVTEAKTMAVNTGNGITTTRTLGKVKAREITGPESCRCSVSNGEIEIDRAFRAGELLIAVSDDDRWF